MLWFDSPAEEGVQVYETPAVCCTPLSYFLLFPSGLIAVSFQFCQTSSPLRTRIVSYFSLSPLVLVQSKVLNACLFGPLNNWKGGWMLSG